VSCGARDRRRLRPERVLLVIVGYEGLVARCLAILQSPDVHRRQGKLAAIALRVVVTAE
jgi:hypothetical protein